MHYLSGRCRMAVVVDLSGKWSILLNSSTFECILPIFRSNRTRTLSLNPVNPLEMWNETGPGRGLPLTLVASLLALCTRRNKTNVIKKQATRLCSVARNGYVCVRARWGKGDSDREEMFARQLHFSRTDIWVVFLFVYLLVFFLFEHIWLSQRKGQVTLAPL